MAIVRWRMKLVWSLLVCSPETSNLCKAYRLSTLRAYTRSNLRPMHRQGLIRTRIISPSHPQRIRSTEQNMLRSRRFSLSKECRAPSPPLWPLRPPPSLYRPPLPIPPRTQSAPPLSSAVWAPRSLPYQRRRLLQNLLLPRRALSHRDLQHRLYLPLLLRLRCRTQPLVRPQAPPLRPQLRTRSILGLSHCQSWLSCLYCWRCPPSHRFCTRTCPFKGHRRYPRATLYHLTYLLSRYPRAHIRCLMTCISHAWIQLIKRGSSVKNDFESDWFPLHVEY